MDLFWISVPAALIGGAILGWGMHTLRTRRKKGEERPVVCEVEEKPAERVRLARLAPENLDEALSAAVYRALAESRGEIDLEISLPERVAVFGKETNAKGTVRLGASSQIREELTKISQKIGEIETKLREFSMKNEEKIAPPEIDESRESDDEERPLF